MIWLRYPPSRLHPGGLVFTTEYHEQEKSTHFHQVSFGLYIKRSSQDYKIVASSRSPPSKNDTKPSFPSRLYSPGFFFLFHPVLARFPRGGGKDIERRRPGAETPARGNNSVFAVAVMQYAKKKKKKEKTKKG